MLDYLRQPCFERLFTQAWKKIKSLNGLRGKVVLDNLSPQEQDLLGGFLGKNCLGKTELTVTLAEMDRVLKNSPLEMGLYNFLELYFGEKIVTNQETSAARSRQWEEFFGKLRCQAGTPAAKAWLDQLFRGTGCGYRTLLGLYRQDPRHTLEQISLCLKALDYLADRRSQKTRTPVFAAFLTGDPHALDQDTPLGRLLYYGIQHFLNKPETDYTAEGKRALFREAGLEEDDVSSNVIVAGLRVCMGHPRFAVFEGANQTSSPLILPLRFLEIPTRWQPEQMIYMVENPAVFSAILDAFQYREDIHIPPLICGSGQPSVAALTLLDQLAQAGCIINYSGDFDVKGLEIALRLAQRYGQNFRPWCFDEKTYLGAAKGKTMEPDQLNSLRKMEVPWDKKLVDTMLEKKIFVYQEAFVEKLFCFTGSLSIIAKKPMTKIY